MRWYYFYTPDYSEWHAHLQHALGAHFALEPILLPKLEIHDSHPRHHFTGSTKKLELVVDAVRSNLGERIVFSDVTWYFNETRVDALASLLEKCGPMAFAQNADGPDLNIGLFVLECTDATLAMWSEALRRVREDANLHDQTVVAEMCVEPTLLPQHLVVARWPHARDPYRETFLALKIFTPSAEPKCVRDSFRRQAMARYGYTLPPDPIAAQYLDAPWPPV
jgi:hypothetical protein